MFGLEKIFNNCYGTLVIINQYGCDSNWASEASPTLGCSIEISRDIYIYIYVVGMSRMSK